MTCITSSFFVAMGQELRVRCSICSTLAITLAKVALVRTSCSQILMTTMLSRPRTRWTSLPRAIFRAIFASQYFLFCFGIRKQISQPCQKQPSTKIARRFVANQKSGTPATSRGCSVQSLMPALTSAIRTWTSVERFPRERTLLICKLRSDFDSESMFFRLSMYGAGSQ